MLVYLKPRPLGQGLLFDEIHDTGLPRVIADFNRVCVYLRVLDERCELEGRLLLLLMLLMWSCHCCRLRGTG